MTPELRQQEVEIRRAFLAFAGERRYRRMVGMATWRGLLPIDLAFWGRFVRATGLSVPDTAPAINALFRVCLVHDEALFWNRVPVRSMPLQEWKRFPWANESARYGAGRTAVVLVCVGCRRAQSASS